MTSWENDIVSCSLKILLFHPPKSLRPGRRLPLFGLFMGSTPPLKTTRMQTSPPPSGVWFGIQGLYVGLFSVNFTDQAVTNYNKIGFPLCEIFYYLIQQFGWLWPRNNSQRVEVCTQIIIVALKHIAVTFNFNWCRFLSVWSTERSGNCIIRTYQRLPSCDYDMGLKAENV